MRAGARQKEKRLAIRVWRVSALAQSSYGYPGSGCSATELQRVRTVYGQLLDGGRRGRCLTTAILLSGGEEEDPAAVVVCRAAQEWLLTLEASRADRALIDKA